MNSSNQISFDRGFVRTDPTTFHDVIGHDRAIEKLRKWTKRADRKGSLLLYGPSGIGKHTLAHLLAKSIYCNEPLADGSPCGVCNVCRNGDRDRRDIGHAEFDASNRKSEKSLRDFIESRRKKSLAEKQVIVVENVDRFEPQQNDIFLEALENPPTETTFVLLATDRKLIRPAIHSRCNLHIVLRALTKRQSHQLVGQFSSRFQIGLDSDIHSLVSAFSRGIPARTVDAFCTLSEMNAKTVGEALIALELDWPNKLLAYWQAILDNHAPDVALQASATTNPAESMRRLRVLINHLFAREMGQPRGVIVDSTLAYVDESASNKLMHRLAELATAASMTRNEMWRLFTTKCLSSDSENDTDAIFAITAALRGVSAIE